MKIIAHLDETSTHFDLFNLRKANEIKGYDPNQIFMTSVGYNMVFAKTFLFGEEKGNNQNPQGLSVEKVQDDIETIVNTNYHHRQQGRV